VTADATPLPGEPTTGRHRAARLHPLGVEVHHLLARAGFKWQPTHHSHGGTA